MPVRSREIHSLSSRIQLPVLRKLLSIMDGQHSALRHGRGWEFLDLAPYQAGDDVRSIDWPATVRTGSPVIKRREATANLQVMLVVDTGREMGALAPSGETKEEIALTACDITLSSPHSDVPKLLARARTVTQRRSLIVIVTDATQPEPTRVSDDLIKSLSVRHQVMQICVADIDPTSLDKGTDVVDVNEGPLPDFLLRDDQLSGEAANVMEMRRAAVTQMLDKRGVIHVDVSSSEEVPRALMRALERGAHVR